MHSGRLELKEGRQQIDFKPAAGRLLRFRVLSTHKPDAATTDKPARAAAFNALQPAEVGAITLSEFALLEHPLPGGPEQQRYLSDLPGLQRLAGAWTRDRPASGNANGTVVERVA